MGLLAGPWSGTNEWLSASAATPVCRSRPAAPTQGKTVVWTREQTRRTCFQYLNSSGNPRGSCGITGTKSDVRSIRCAPSDCHAHCICTGQKRVILDAHVSVDGRSDLKPPGQQPRPGRSVHDLRWKSALRSKLHPFSSTRRSCSGMDPPAHRDTRRCPSPRWDTSAC